MDYTKSRGDLNEARRNEQRLKDRIKVLRDGGGEGKEGGGGVGDRLEDLEKKIRVLTAQNAALRSAVDTATETATGKYAWCSCDTHQGTTTIIITTTTTTT